MNHAKVQVLLQVRDQEMVPVTQMTVRFKMREKDKFATISWKWFFLECAEKGGQSAGSCAAGFGTCCVFATSTCGSDIVHNSSYVRNEGFPTSINGAHSCMFTIKKCDARKCQYLHKELCHNFYQKKFICLNIWFFQL